MQLSPLAPVFVQRDSPRPPGAPNVAAASAQAGTTDTQQQQQPLADASTSCVPADSASPLRMQAVPTIKRMLDQSISLDNWNQAGRMFAHQPDDARAVAAAAEAGPSSRAGDASQQSSAPVPAQQHTAMRHPPPGFGPPQHSSSMQQPVLGIPAAARQEQFQEPFRADVPISQAPAGYYPHGSQGLFAPQQQPQQQPMPQRPPSFNQRVPADGAQWLGRPPSPLDSPQQPGFFAFSPAQPYGPYAQQHQGAPRPPFEHAPYAAFAGGPAGFDHPPAGFPPMAGPPAAGGYAPWQPQQQQYSQPSQAEAVGLYALQHLAQQRRQAHQQHSMSPAAAAAALNKQMFRSYPTNHNNGNYNSAYHTGQRRPPAGAGAAPGMIGSVPPPPPRQAAPMHGQRMNAIKPGQHAGYAPVGYFGNAAFGQVCQPAAYTGFGIRHGSTMQPGMQGNGGEGSLGERRASNAGGVDANPLIAALPRSSSALWESAGNSPRASTSNLRKSSSCDSFPRLTAESATAQGAPGSMAGAPPSNMPFTPAVLLTHDGARATYAAASKLGMRNSSGGGSFMSALGRASIRSLAWDPMSTLSSGGGARPSAGGAGAGSARTPGKPCAMAAKVPLIYTPATLMEHAVWASNVPVNSGGSNGFGTSQLMPDQLELMFRRLRADVRGPDARPI
jgi:hypothetical protein